jgi:hypothetical protein
MLHSSGDGAIAVFPRAANLIHVASALVIPIGNRPVEHAQHVLDHMADQMPKPTAADRIADALDEIKREKPTLWRVDIAGQTVLVHGEDAYRHIQSVNHKLARMKMALHRIMNLDVDDWSNGRLDHAKSIALEALAKVEG